MKLGKERMFFSIHMEGVLLVHLMTFDMKAIFGLDREMLYLLSYINQYFSLKSSDIKIHIDDDGSGFFPKHRVRNIFNAKYQETYANRSYVLSNHCIKYMRIC